MRELRMPKGWIHIGTNAFEFGNTETKAEKSRREKKVNDIIRSTKVTKPIMVETKGVITFIAQDLIDEGDKAAVAKKARKDNLMTAFAEKKLKSKSLIREAQGYNKKKQSNKQVKPV
jgi:hypothetical protein